MFILDIRHYAALLLHPKYSLLGTCLPELKQEIEDYVLDEMTAIEEGMSTPKSKRRQTNDASIRQKRKKTAAFMFDEFSYYSEVQTSIDDDDDDNDDLNDTNTKIRSSSDELMEYRVLVSKTSEHLLNQEDPTAWWKQYKQYLPVLAQVAQRLFSIPATSAAVERTFSSAGYIYSNRRANLAGTSLDDIILVRSKNKMKMNDIRAIDEQ